MKIGNRKIENANEVIIPIPRTDGDIIFIAKGVLDTSKFDKLCPMPEPPKTKRRINGMMQTVADVDNPVYVAKIQKWAEKKNAWLFMESLRDTPELIWEKVKTDDPNTWSNCFDEMRDSGLTEHEIIRIINGVSEANGVSEVRVQEARERFLIEREARLNGQPSQKEDQENMQSGELVKDQESNSQDLEKSTVGTN